MGQRERFGQRKIKKCRCPGVRGLGRQSEKTLSLRKQGSGAGEEGRKCSRSLKQGTGFKWNKDVDEVDFTGFIPSIRRELITSVAG